MSTFDAGGGPRVRIACLEGDSVAGHGLCAMLQGADRYDVVDDPRADVALTVVHLGQDEDGQLSRIVSLSAISRVLVVGPADLTADALRAGAVGYATPSSRVHDFLGVVEMTLSGRRALTQEATEFLIDNSGERLLRAEDLTPRQTEILGHLLAGDKLATIASHLGVSRQAVGQTLERLRRRARVDSNAALARFVRDHRLLEGN